MSKIEEFLNIYKGSSRSTYSSAIFKFVQCVYEVSIKGKGITKAEKPKCYKMADKYIADGSRVHYDDLIKFASSLRMSPPKTARTYMSIVTEFLSFNGIELERRQLKNIKMSLPKGNGARTVEMDMEKETIRRILGHLDLKGTTLMLVLSSSGMRIGESLQIELEDIDMDATPTPITIRGEYTKSGEQRITFISKEAKASLKEWFKVRKQYIENSMNKPYGADKDIHDNRVFPFSDTNVYKMWIIALEKTGLYSKDRKTGRTQLRIHQLRKYFRSQLALGCPVDVVEVLMGHEGYLTDAYRRLPTKQLAEYYSKYEHLLYISAPKDLQRIEDEFKAELQSNSKFMHQISSEQQTKIRNLEDQLENISTINKSQIEEYVEDVAIENNKLKTEMAEMRELINKLVYEQAKANMKAK